MEGKSGKELWGWFKLGGFRPPPQSEKLHYGLTLLDFFGSVSVVVSHGIGGAIIRATIIPFMLLVFCKSFIVIFSSQNQKMCE